MPRGGLKRSLSPTANGKRTKVAKTDSTACGVIEELSLDDFMCHSNFSWSPNKNINFITGANGSGKSSILQGLVLGLLADSKATKRYSKLQDFIKKGSPKAEIKVTLRNEGEDAYKPEVYGRALTFHRTIYESGQTTVQIRDHAGNKIITRNKDARDEGKRVLECFKINVDNPIAILQQEEAKELLKVESPEALYVFFQKSTLLKQCIDHYSTAQVEIDKSKESLKLKKKGLEEQKREYELKLKEVGKMVKSTKLTEDEERLSMELVLASKVDNKSEQDAIQTDIEKKQAMETAAMDRLKSLNQASGETEMEKQKVELKIEDEKEKHYAKENELQSCKLETEKLKEQEKNYAKDIKGYENTKRTFESEIRILTEQIQESSSSASARMRKQKELETKQRLKELDLKTTEIQDEINSLGVERDSAEKNQEANKKDHDLKTYEKKALETKLSTLRKELVDLEKSGNKQLAMFDPKAPKVAEKIREAVSRRQFKVKPIGPVGHYVKLAPEAMGQSPNLPLLIETEIGPNNLRSYLVNDDHDRVVLRNIFDEVYGKVGRKPNITTSKFLDKCHNVNRVKGQKTLMDYLDIVGDPIEKCVVFNYLVDQKNIEAIVIVKSQDEAKSLCTFIQNVPQNMSYCSTLDFNRFFPPSKNTSYRSYYIEAVGTKLLGTSMDAKMKDLQHLISSTESKLKELIEDISLMEKKKQSFAKDIQEIQTKITKLRKDIATCNSTKSKLKSEEDPTEHLQSMKDQLNRKQEELKTLLGKQAETIEKKKETTALAKEKSVEYNKLLKNVSKAREAYDPLETERNRLEGLLTTKRKEIMNQEKVTKRIQHEIVNLKKSLDELMKRGKKTKDILERMEKDWKKKYPQLPMSTVPSGTFKQLNAKILNIKKQKSQLENSGFDLEALTQELEGKKERFLSNRKKLESLEMHIKTLEDMNRDRNTNFLYIRNAVTNMVQRRFAVISETFTKQFGTGITIKLNHKQRSLDWVFKDSQGGPVSLDINSLSGGEKSYAQMCLIASLWENMNPPFRCLDEWDVFLDALNRKSISQTLLGFGLKHVDYQFIFISPQGAGDIKTDVSESDKVSILEVQKSQ